MLSANFRFIRMRRMTNMAMTYMTTESKTCPNCKATLRPSRFPGAKYYCPNYKTCKYREKSNYVKQEVVYREIPELKTMSDEQRDVVRFAENQDCHIVIRALAGTGKTTLATQTVRVYKKNKKNTMCLVFGRRDKGALEEKMTGNATVKTSNGAGLKILNSHFPGRPIEGKKDFPYYILKEYAASGGSYNMKSNEWEKGHAQAVRKAIALVDKARSTMRLNCDENMPGCKVKPDGKDYAELAERFGLEIKEGTWDTVLQYAFALFESLSSLKRLQASRATDFTGMVFLPSYYNLQSKENYDRIVVDECQDQSYINRRIVQLHMQKDTLITAVGDNNQAIYAWRGADIKSMFEMQCLMKQTAKVKSFPLTICRRCPKAVIEVVKNIVPDIQALPNAPEGEVLYQDEEEMTKKLIQDRKGLVLCRANAPLFSICLNMLKHGVPAVIAKSGIIDEITNIVDNCSENTDSMSVQDFIPQLENWYIDKTAKFANATNAETISQIAADKRDCIMALLDDVKVRTAGDIKSKLWGLFPDGDATPDAEKMIVLSTVHGAKGGEAHTVYMFSPAGKEGSVSLWDAIWDDETDRDNVLYVAMTRAEHTLAFVGPAPTLSRFSPLPNDEEEVIVEEKPVVKKSAKKVVKKEVKKPVKAKKK